MEEAWTGSAIICFALLWLAEHAQASSKQGGDPKCAVIKVDVEEMRNDVVIVGRPIRVLELPGPLRTSSHTTLHTALKVHYSVI